MVAVQNEADFRMAHMCVANAIDDRLRGMVAPHSINRNDEFAGQARAILQTMQEAPE